MSSDPLVDRLSELRLRVLREKMNAISSNPIVSQHQASQPAPYYSPLVQSMAEHQAAMGSFQMMQAMQASLQMQCDQLEATIKRRTLLRKQLENFRSQMQREEIQQQTAAYSDMMESIAHSISTWEKRREQENLQQRFSELSSQNRSLQQAIESVASTVITTKPSTETGNHFAGPLAAQAAQTLTHPMGAYYPPPMPFLADQASFYPPYSYPPQLPFPQMLPSPSAPFDPSQVNSANQPPFLRDKTMPSSSVKSNIDSTELTKLLKFDELDAADAADAATLEENGNKEDNAVEDVFLNASPTESSSSSSDASVTSGKGQLRALAHMVRYFVRTRERLDLVEQQAHAEQLKEFEMIVDLEIDTARFWLWLRVKTALLSVMNEPEMDLSLPAPAPVGTDERFVQAIQAEQRSRAMKIKVRVGHCLKSLRAQLDSRDSVPELLLTFIHTYLIGDKVHLPQNSVDGQGVVVKRGFLLPSEQSDLTFNRFGAVIRLTTRSRRMLVLNFFVTRVMVGLFLEPWVGEYIKKSSVEALPHRHNLPLLATVLCRIVRAALHPNADVTAEHISARFSEVVKQRQQLQAEAAARSKEASELEASGQDSTCARELAKAAEAAIAATLSSLEDISVPEIPSDPSVNSLGLLPDEATTHCNSIVAELLPVMLDCADRLIALANKQAGRVDLGDLS